MEIKELKLKIVELIAKDELDKALNLLQENMPMNHPRYVSLIMQMRRLNNLKNKTINATIAFEEASRERNKISQSLIEMTQSLSESPPPPPATTEKVPVKVAPIKKETPRVEQPPKYKDDLLDDYDDDDFDEEAYDKKLDELIKPSTNGLKGYQKEILYEGSPAKEEEFIVFRLTYDIAFFKCIQAIQNNGFTLKQQNQSMGYIQATTGISIWSFGEEIHIYLKELDGGMTTSIRIICDSVVKTTVTSWGKNAKNIQKILTTLKQGF